MTRPRVSIFLDTRGTVLLFLIINAVSCTGGAADLRAANAVAGSGIALNVAAGNPVAGRNAAAHIPAFDTVTGVDIAVDFPTDNTVSGCDTSTDKTVFAYHSKITVYIQCRTGIVEFHQGLFLLMAVKQMMLLQTVTEIQNSP